MEYCNNGVLESWSIGGMESRKEKNEGIEI
jgi:hypothetical protein